MPAGPDEELPDAAQESVQEAPDEASAQHSSFECEVRNWFIFSKPSVYYGKILDFDWTFWAFF